ncbi:GNAT family N-acetyltransferase [Calothrix sp. PCC 7507]|uniref:GNAT family N-acetyltransferase n=1 Tax=Calothrix sp. PCC 7507 TaxID=99598 RepID=UPI00029F1326|nr:GNAT family N-acetyltransferase [Calothrix sp. PCC 7507]AFY33582.1 GCN5-related N-acetyltransferase [Calothrix sp. PCC 7507]
MYSQRLCLEPLEPDHAERLFDGLQSASIYDFIEDVPPQSVEWLRDRYMMLARRQSPDGTEIWLNWAVWSLVEKCYVGYVQATITVDNSAILGYVFFPDFWGKGYAREAVNYIINYLVGTYQNLNFCANVDVQNHRSIALLQNLGFVRSTFVENVESNQDEFNHEIQYRKL